MEANTRSDGYNKKDTGMGMWTDDSLQDEQHVQLVAKKLFNDLLPVSRKQTSAVLESHTEKLSPNNLDDEAEEERKTLNAAQDALRELIKLTESWALRNSYDYKKMNEELQNIMESLKAKKSEEAYYWATIYSAPLMQAILKLRSVAKKQERTEVVPQKRNPSSSFFSPVSQNSINSSSSSSYQKHPVGKHAEPVVIPASTITLPHMHLELPKHLRAKPDQDLCHCFTYILTIAIKLLTETVIPAPQNIKTDNPGTTKLYNYLSCVGYVIKKLVESAKTLVQEYDSYKNEVAVPNPAIPEENTPAPSTPNFKEYAQDMKSKLHALDSAKINTREVTPLVDSLASSLDEYAALQPKLELAITEAQQDNRSQPNILTQHYSYNATLFNTAQAILVGKTKPSQKKTPKEIMRDSMKDWVRNFLFRIQNIASEGLRANDACPLLKPIQSMSAFAVTYIPIIGSIADGVSSSINYVASGQTTRHYNNLLHAIDIKTIEEALHEVIDIVISTLDEEINNLSTALAINALTKAIDTYTKDDKAAKLAKRAKDYIRTAALRESETCPLADFGHFMAERVTRSFMAKYYDSVIDIKNKKTKTDLVTDCLFYLVNTPEDLCDVVEKELKKIFDWDTDYKFSRTGEIVTFKDLLERKKDTFFEIAVEYVNSSEPADDNVEHSTSSISFR